LGLTKLWGHLHAPKEQQHQQQQQQQQQQLHAQEAS
jgi:hypothetical protein